MPDPRFFRTNASLTASEIAAAADGEFISGLEMTEVSHVAGYEAAGPGSLIYVAKVEDLGRIGASSAQVCFVPSGLPCEEVSFGDELTIIAVSSPRGAFARIADLLHDSLMDVFQTTGDNPQDSGARPVIASDAVIDNRAVLYPGCEIGQGAKIAAGVIIGPGVIIGAQSYIGPNACVSHAIIGAGCRLSSGAVIGGAGFGYVMEDGNRRMPQLGRVLIEDEVDVGSNSTIDRGTLGDTVIGARTKIDNQVQIAHNARIGTNCIFAAQVGISGSTIVGDNVVFAGSSAAADHLCIGEGAVILAGSGVTKDVPAGETWFGYPARPAAQWWRREAGLNRLLKSTRKKR